MRYIVTLTSYGRRVGTSLIATLQSLVEQTVKPDRIVVWLGNNEWNSGNLPSALQDIVRSNEGGGGGLDIRFCEDMRSYKKLIPALRAFPDDALITADDDIIYAHNWFELLKTEHERYPLCIVFHRAHKVYADKDNPRHPLPYRYWGLEEFPAENESSDWFFPTGGAGALYPPGSLHPVVSETAEFQALAPTGDDIWFWACAKLQKTPYRYIPNGYRSITSTPMPDGDRPLLFINVVANGNNTQITALCARFPELGDAVETFPRKKVDLREMWRVGCWEVRKGIEKVVGKKAYAFLKRLYAQVVLKRKEM